MAAWSSSGDTPSSADTAGAEGVADVLVLAGRRGKCGEAGMAPSMTVHRCEVHDEKR